MISDDLRAWQSRMTFTTVSAAAALGVHRSGYAAWLAGSTPIDRRTALACAAIEAGLAPAGMPVNQEAR